MFTRGHQISQSRLWHRPVRWSKRAAVTRVHDTAWAQHPNKTHRRTDWQRPSGQRTRTLCSPLTVTSDAERRELFSGQSHQTLKGTSVGYWILLTVIRRYGRALRGRGRKRRINPRTKVDSELLREHSGRTSHVRGCYHG